MILFNYYIIRFSFLIFVRIRNRVNSQLMCTVRCAQNVNENTMRTMLITYFRFTLITFVILLLSEHRANVVAWCNSTFRRRNTAAINCLVIGVKFWFSYAYCIHICCSLRCCAERGRNDNALCSMLMSLFSVLLLQRNGTLTEVSTINTGHNGMDKFGYLDQLNGMNQLPFWDTEPCTNITASEGSFFPPREFTKSDMRYVYDKDLCRIIPLQFVRTVYKDGIPADLYEMPENTFGDAANNPNNSCYDTDDYKAVKGLQNISPCQYSECDHQNWGERKEEWEKKKLKRNKHSIRFAGAPVYISNPHFYLADPELLDAVEGLKPNKSIHESYFKIQPVICGTHSSFASMQFLMGFLFRFALFSFRQKLGVPLEGKVRVQLNLKVENTRYITSLKNFRSFVFPIIWVEEVTKWFRWKCEIPFFF